MEKTKTLKILNFNANGVKNQKEEIKTFLQLQNIDIAIITETHLRASDKFKIANYVTHRKDRKDRQGGGVAILIKKNIKHYPYPNTEENHNMETTGIQIDNEKLKMKIYAIYCPPKADIDEKELDHIMKGTIPTLCAGDLNSKNKEWKCKSDNKKGKNLARYMENRNLTVLAPTEPTHTPPNGSPDILDIAILKNITKNIECEVLEDLNSDHYPVIIEIKNSIIERDAKIELHDIQKFKQSFKTPQQKIQNKKT